MSGQQTDSTISEKATAELCPPIVDFTGGDPNKSSLGTLQLEGAQALDEILEKQLIAYLADEVGMGKTYIALGVVAAQRRRNPGMKVLYLLPKQNVRSKWVKDYRSFVRHNYQQQDLVVRGADDHPASPPVVCENMAQLIREVSTGQGQDIFICSSAFSIPLGNDKKALIKSVNTLARELPGAKQDVANFKAQINDCEEDSQAFYKIKAESKQLWARTLNRVLPRFDLIIVDEAHNFKHGTGSSDRNRTLATILGANDDEHKRFQHALLLSATPWARSISELRNQLAMFGHKSLLDDIPEDGLHQRLAGFMVRRLNALHCGPGQKLHTRNMYREEHRTGDKAHVQLNDEQKLVAALMQRKVSQHLRRNCAGKYQIGMLSSFESYQPGRGATGTFDGDQEETRADAQDEGVVTRLVKSYREQFKHLPPHPKMDWVADQLQQAMFEEGKKQLVFVRRVASVGELKRKLAEHYDRHIGLYLKETLKDSFALNFHRKYIELYRNSTTQDAPSSVIEQDDSENKREDSVDSGTGKTTRDDFFTWFYRGNNPAINLAASRITGEIAPASFRTRIAQSSPMFELNWVAQLQKEQQQSYSNEQMKAVLEGREFAKSDASDQKIFLNAQYAWLSCLERDENADNRLRAKARLLNSYLFSTPPARISLSDTKRLESALHTRTLFDELASSMAELLPDGNADLFSFLDYSMSGSLQRPAQELSLRRLECYRVVFATLCRIDHPFIDLYSVRQLGKGQQQTGDEQQRFFALLQRQKASEKAFSSYQILKHLAEQLDLILKLNFSEALDKPAGELSRHVVSQLQGIQSVAEASGENSGDRTPLARRFRMPGYPMALVSTNVFQEGEDLHTFCDSVTHYGISTSPIALEQKVGRVDRIGSMAHRNLRCRDAAPEESFIQVVLPYIKESAEYIQVQQSAWNYNRFIEALHLVEEQKQTVDDEVDIDRAPEPVEPAITTELKSPFEATHHLSDTRLALWKLGGDDNHSALNQIREALKRQKKGLQLIAPTGIQLRESEAQFHYHLRSALRPDELIFSISQLHTSELSMEAVIDKLETARHTTGWRFQARQEKDGWTLLHNVERLLSANKPVPDTLIDEMTADLAQPAGFVAEYSDVSTSVLEKAVDALPEQANGEGVEVKNKGKSLNFHFTRDGRRQEVSVRGLHGGYLLSSRAVAAASLEGSQSMNNRLRWTAERNDRFDLVDFFMDDAGGISVRAFCKDAERNAEELIRSAWRVAREADRLEFVTSHKDLF